MTENDVSIDTEAANAWINEVKSEIEITKGILQKIANCLEKDPDDDIWFEFERVAKNLTLYWEGLNKAMENACNAIKSAIEELWKTAEEIIQMIRENAAKLAT